MNMTSTIHCFTGHFKEGDEFTIAGHGYDRKDRLIINGHFVETGKKTRAKIVRLRLFVVKKVSNGTMDIAPKLIPRTSA